MNDNSVLYHYCSLATFYNIIKNKSIWLSDVLKSNDFLELVVMRQLFIKQLNEIIDKKAIKYSEAFDFERAIQLNDLKRETYDETRKEVAKHLVFCLSEDGDLLSQWRGYADDGNGISIGFKKDFLSKVNALNTERFPKRREYFQFDQVSYDESAAIDFIKEESGLENFHLHKNIEEERKCLREALSKIAIVAPFHKTTAFSEEREWRMIISYMLWSFENPDFSHYNNCDFQFKNIEYIVSKGKLIPHIEMIFSDIKKAIASITIGPKCSESIIDIRNFLICMGVLEDYKDNSIIITKSKASYR